MNIQYRFQLIFLKLILKRTLISDGLLTITLLEPNKQQTPTFQPDEIYIKRNESVIKLDSLSPFQFSSSIESGDNALLKYEIRGKSENMIRTVPLNIRKMIRAFEDQNQCKFEETFSGESAQISYKCSISKFETQVFNLLVTPSSEAQSPESRKRAGSLSKSKRPPTLNLVKKNLNQKVPQKQLQSPQSGNTSSNFLLANKDYDKESVSVISGSIQKISTDPLKQIEKVKELMSSHHRPEQQDQQNHRLSYKLKIVFAMLIYGILFLLYDTLSDRSSKSIKMQQSKSIHNHNTPNKNYRKPQSQEKKPKEKKKKKKRNSKNK